LEFLFPPEITGLVVLMVGIGVVPLGVSKFLGINYAGEPISALNLLVATVTLFVMVGINVWGKGKLKLYSVLIGMGFGYSLSLVTGLLTAIEFRQALAVPWLALPVFDGMWNFSFRWSLLPTFIIVSICGALKSFGNLILCEKVNDDQWSRPNIKRIGDGLMADGLCVTASGLLGGMASDTSASNVALSSASAATSRWIGFAAGGLFVVLGFSPKLSAVLSIMPMPVMGAILVFLVSFMIMSSLQIILGTKPDASKSFVIGLSLIFGLSLEALPDLYAHVAPWLRPLFESSLSFTAILAVLLNQSLRLGKREIDPAIKVTEG
jgi:NCS2 family nucleobase:cation symporter-2